MVTFATDYWAPALDSKARRRMTDLEGRTVQAMKKNLSRSTTTSSFRDSYHNNNNNNNNPKRNSSYSSAVNATKPIQTPFQYNKPVIISSGTSPAGVSSSPTASHSSSDYSSSASSSASSSPSTPCTEAGSYIYHDNKADERSICDSIEIVVNNTEHKKKNLVQKLFTHDANSSKVVMPSSPKDEPEEFNFKHSPDNVSIFKGILHPKLGGDSNNANNHNNNYSYHSNSDIGSVMVRSDSGVNGGGYGNDSYSKSAECESLLLKKYGVCDKGCIGKGATAVVRLAHKYDSSECERTYAVKEFRKKRKNESEKDYVKKLTSEFCISSTLHHVNIVRTVDFLQDENHNWCEVMEYCAGGDLYSAIKASHMTSIEINCCFKQLIMGIGYLHSMGVAHRDIKPENLLLDKNGHLKITDFGVSDVFRTCWEEEVHFSKGLCGSEPYIAPEQFETKEYDARLVDIWACGIVYYCMLYQGIPFRMATPTDPNYSNYLETKSLGLYEPFERLPRGCRDLMFRILEPDTKLRIKIEEIKNNAWFKSIESCSEFVVSEPELESSSKSKSSSKSSLCAAESETTSSRKCTLTQEHKHIPPVCLKEIQEKDGKNGVKDNHNDKDNSDNHNDKSKQQSNKSS